MLQCSCHLVFCLFCLGYFEQKFHLVIFYVKYKDVQKSILGLQEMKTVNLNHTYFKV